MEVTRHFTATTFVVCGDRVLLHMHKKLGRWLPVGGHIDRDELPSEAALREVKEEADLDVTLHSSKSSLHRFKDVQELAPPAYLLLEDIHPYHQHIDFVYFGSAVTDKIGPNASEKDTLQWFTEEELANQEDMPDDVIKLAQEALETVRAS